ncbi:HNH endonuclease [Kitasatospora gansuensis]
MADDPAATPPLTEQLEADLARRTEAIRKAGPTTATGRAAWRTARDPKAKLRTLLHRMTPGLLRCMYCGDNLGTDIDHFEPIARAPLRTFDWHNHLLACAYCNSNQKRDRFPCDPASGDPLLIDPATEDPADHLLLYLESGAYQGLTAKGHATIDVFALNSRAELVRGRRLAFTVVKALLRDWHTRTAAATTPPPPRSPTPSTCSGRPTWSARCTAWPTTARWRKWSWEPRPWPL